ncbi:unnamed protein product (macronuclear) [Paramecium tetraurelia]|uniref:Uncharacterized protein n=1 Tax=Paramecium tetraurelia TaxID=5888 RepID=A0CDX0_PARTE|nr:uncharacterized protein GSPATT00007199001 [Paramecium tetraurelia]CAK68987.1 unnamed protein product [Paramecium tetraurelia]|eukprot:XP_001436384.1 hypothetical protein (macronuclear) [Paramecium tetraurelia strain d4-2]
MYTHHQFKAQCELVISQCYYKEGVNRQNLLRDEQHLLLMLSNSYHHNHSKELQLIDQLLQDYRHLQIYIYLQNIVKHVEKHLHVILNYSHDPFQMNKKLTKQIGTIQYAGHHIHHFPELHSLGKMFREYFGMNVDQFEVCSQMVELCSDLQLLKNVYLSYFCKNYGLMAITVQNNGHYFTDVYKTYDFYIPDEDYALPPPGGYSNIYPTTQNQSFPPPYGQNVNTYPQTYNPLPPPGQYPPTGQYPQSGQYPPPGQYPPGQYPPGQYPQGQYPPPGQIPPPNQYPGQGQYPPPPQQYPNQQPTGYGAQPYQQGQQPPYQQPYNPTNQQYQSYPQQQTTYPPQQPSPGYPTSNAQQYNNPSQQQGYPPQPPQAASQPNYVPMPPPANQQFPYS